MKSKALLALLALPGAALAQVTYTESEPNDTVATANSFSISDTGFGTGMGPRIVGVASGTDVDRFNLGITRNYEVQANAILLDRASTGGIHGFSLTAAGTADLSSDPIVQAAFISGASSSNRFVTISPAQMRYSIAGTGTELYRAANSQLPIFTSPGTSGFDPYNATDAGTFSKGFVTISAGSQTIDSDIVLLANIPGQGGLREYKANNDASPLTLGSLILMDLPIGEYLLAVSDVNLVTGLLPDADEFARTPNDPRTHVFGATGLLASSSSANVAIPLSISDSNGRSYSATANKTGININFYRFTVTAPPVPEPATLAALGCGALALLKRRRKA